MSRDTAFDVLRSGSLTPMREVARFAERDGLDGRDRGLTRALVGCEVRRRATLRAIVKTFAKGHPSTEVATLLRLGAAQLLFMDAVPDHAAVSETVRVATERISLPRGRYVNGVLRTLQRSRQPGHCGDPRRDLVGADWHFSNPVFRDPEEHPLLWAEDALSMPSNLLKRWAKRYGQDEAFRLAQQALQEPELSVVFWDGGRDAWLERWSEWMGRPGSADSVALFPASAAGDVLASEAFATGVCSVQGETAWHAAAAVQAQADERVLDVCAAPGGKTAYLARQGAHVTAVDVSAKRLAQVHNTLERLAITDRVTCLESDGTAALDPETERFDAALVDAPCSNTGVLGARPGARWRFGPQSQKELINLQERLLREAADWVRPGGRLVYSTCSLESDENSQVVRRFLEEQAAWTLESEVATRPGENGVAGPVDGGFHARLRRSDDA